MKKLLAALLLTGLIPAAQAIDAFNPSTRVLSLDSVVVNGVQYNNVSVLLNSYFLLGVGSSQPWIPDTCGDQNINNVRYNAIQLGMTVDAVSLTLGCKYDPNMIATYPLATIYTWRNGTAAYIYVWFDQISHTAKDIGGGIFKQGVGF